MVKWYLRQIQMNRMALEDVPKRWHDKVKAELENEQTDEDQPVFLFVQLERKKIMDPEIKLTEEQEKEFSNGKGEDTPNE